MCCPPLLEIDINIFAKIYISRLTKREKMIDLEIDNISSNFSRAIENVVVQVAESCLFRGEPPPAKDRLEYPVPQTDTGRSFFSLATNFFCAERNQSIRHSKNFLLKPSWVSFPPTELIGCMS